ncbi:MAG: SMC family ATPase [Candidatus Bathyarchaeota archaeon]|nr:MAG: SMC family ATPase [Candidatus Bathyarchaeota archaeon]
MKLQSLQLENIRSHVKTKVPFVGGFNCLVGGLGQGKSTVLYAIDFVLFGDPIGRSYDYLLREDAQKGKVTAEFIHNGKHYKIQRALERKGNGISQDTDHLKLYKDGELVASNKNDAVLEELTALTGLDKNIFREIIWVRQEHLKELIDITPRQRQTKLDKLFGLSNYDIAWSGLHQFEREYEVEKRVLERDVDVIRVGKLEENYINAVEEFSSITGQIHEAKQKFAQAESELMKASACLESLEEMRKTTEELQRKQVQLKTNLGNLGYQIKKMSVQNETEKRRLDELKRLLNQMETKEEQSQRILQEIGWDLDKPLTEYQNQLSRIEEQLRTIRVEQGTTQREMQTSEANISSIVAENKCPRCLQELTGDYKDSLKNNLQQEKAEKQKLLTELQEKLDELRNVQSKASTAVSNLQQVILRIEDTKRQINEKHEFLAQNSLEIQKAEEDKKNLQKQLEETRTEIANFDVAELDFARKNKETALTVHRDAKNELTNLERKKDDLAIRVDELKERIDIVQKKIERKESIYKLLEIIDRIRVAYRSIQPKLRKEFVTYLQLSVQQMLDNLVGDLGPTLNVKIDETYSPFVNSQEGYEREVSNLSGGERTLLAFAYRIGLGQLIMQAKTGHGLYMLLLDEPTESLGREDGSVDRLAEAVSRLNSIEQIIAVTHNESFAEKAEHVIRIEKENGESQVYIDK